MSSSLDRIATTKLEAIFGKLFNTDLAKFMEASAVVKKEDGLGLEIKNMVVISVGFQSQFLGELLPGDILIGINGQQVSQVAQFVKTMQTAFQTVSSTKVTLKFVRLKKRVARPPQFPGFQKTDGYIYETAVIYNYRGFFQLGLEVREIEGRVMICHTTENTLADMFLSTGAFIMDVDGVCTMTCTAFNERIKKSFEIKNYALITLAIPNTDYLKNIFRKKIAAATREMNMYYPVPYDARMYASEGIAAIKAEREPEPIWVGDGKTKGPSLRTEVPEINYVKNVVETDVPTSWNSFLFVKIPPTKSADTEIPP